MPSKDLGARANQEISTSAADTISTGYGLGGGGGRKDLNVLLGQVNWLVLEILYLCSLHTST